MPQPWAKSFYKSKQWQAVRGYILKRDLYMCQCHRLTGQEECGLPASEVHHIEWLTPQNIRDPAIALNADNLIALSRDCHMREHKQQRREAVRHIDCDSGFAFDERGMLVQR